MNVRLIPWLIDGMAALHVLAGLARVTVLHDIAAAGVIDTVAGHDDRGAAVWFIAAGLGLLAMGELARWTVDRTGRLPARLGWWLIGISGSLTLLLPVSGSILGVAIGALTVRAAHAR
jgi:Family of unknown function (DUF6463)